MFLGFLGKIRFTAEGANYKRLLDILLRARTGCRNLCEKNSVVTGIIPFYRKKQICQICQAQGLAFTVVEQTGLLYRLAKFRHRWGIAVGFFAALALVLVLSNLLLKVRIEGCDEDLQQRIRAALADNGIATGTFLPAVDYFALENELMLEVDGVAWAGIRNAGSTLVIQISQEIEKPDSSQSRLPTNVIATRDCSLVRAQVYSGKLIVPLGSGVQKGDVLIAGQYEDDKGNQYYARSFGKIYGEFEETVTFVQPFEDTQQVLYPNAESRSFLNFYEAELRLFWGEEPQGQYVKTSHSANLSFLGWELPVGITQVNYDAYEDAATTYTPEEALAVAQKLADNYKANFLSECEILSEERSEECTDTQASVTLTFRAVGEVGEEQEILIDRLPGTTEKAAKKKESSSN